MSSIFKPGGPTRYAHQNKGLRRLLHQKGIGMLLFDPGLGKTATVIDYASVLALKLPSQEARVLVVCPLCAVDTWGSQMERWTADGVHFYAEALNGSILEKCEALASRGGQPFPKPLTDKRGKGMGPRQRARWMRDKDTRHLNNHLALSINVSPGCDPAAGPDGVPKRRIVLCTLNLDALSRRDKVGSKTVADLMLEAVKRFNPDLVVVDESHLIKGTSSNASRLLARIGKQVPRRVALTGTAMPQSPLDIYAQMRFVDPNVFSIDRNGATKPMNRQEFEHRYGVLGGWMGKQVVGYKHLDELKAKLRKVAVVAQKEDALDLPPTSDVTITVHLSPREQRAYAEAKSKAMQVNLDEQGTATIMSKLTQVLRLRQITSGHIMSDDNEVITLGTSKVDAAASLIHDTLAGEKRVVVFANFRHELMQLKEKLKAKGTKVLFVDGSVSHSERMAIRKLFGSNSKERLVLVAQTSTMSTAVNELVTASHCVYFSLPLRRDELVQSRDRLNRLGQTRPVTYWYLEVPHTVDGVIRRSHEQRTNLEQELLEHIQTGPSQLRDGA